MPATTWIDLAGLATWEERLRHNVAAFSPNNAIALKPYWAQVIALFEVYRQITHQPDLPVTPEALSMLRPGHRWLVEHRWPTRKPLAMAP